MHFKEDSLTNKPTKIYNSMKDKGFSSAIKRWSRLVGGVGGNFLYNGIVWMCVPNGPLFSAKYMIGPFFQQKVYE